MTISPALTGMSPATIIISVLLPQPDGPTTERNSPVRRSKLAPSTAVRSRPRARNDFSTALISTNGAGSALRAAGSVLMSRPGLVLLSHLNIGPPPGRLRFAALRFGGHPPPSGEGAILNLIPLRLLHPSPNGGGWPSEARPGGVCLEFARHKRFDPAGLRGALRP